MIESSLRILRTDISGMPIEWVGFEDAVKLHCLEQILYPMGSSLYVVRDLLIAARGETALRNKDIDEHHAGTMPCCLTEVCITNDSLGGLAIAQGYK